nr:MAG TPA: hypothetical protein [Caudoviricetes sp.]
MPLSLLLPKTSVTRYRKILNFGNRKTLIYRRL